MKSNLLNKHFLKTGEALSIANVFKVLGSSNVEIINYFQKSSPKIDEKVQAIEDNCKKSEDDIEIHENLLDDIVKDYKTLLNTNTQLKGKAIILQKGFMYRILYLEDKILALFT